MSKVSRQNLRKALVEYHGGKCKCCGYKRFWECLWFLKTNPLDTSQIDDNKSFDSQLALSQRDHVLICANCDKAIKAGRIKMHAYTLGVNPRIGFFTETHVEIISEPQTYFLKISDALELEFVTDVKEEELKNVTKYESRT